MINIEKIIRKRKNSWITIKAEIYCSKIKKYNKSLYVNQKSIKLCKDRENNLLICFWKNKTIVFVFDMK